MKYEDEESKGKSIGSNRNIRGGVGNSILGLGLGEDVDPHLAAYPHRHSYEHQHQQHQPRQRKSHSSSANNVSSIESSSFDDGEEWNNERGVAGDPHSSRAWFGSWLWGSQNIANGKDDAGKNVNVGTMVAETLVDDSLLLQDESQPGPAATSPKGSKSSKMTGIRAASPSHPEGDYQMMRSNHGSNANSIDSAPLPFGGYSNDTNEQHSSYEYFESFSRDNFLHAHKLLNGHLEKEGSDNVVDSNSTNSSNSNTSTNSNSKSKPLLREKDKVEDRQANYTSASDEPTQETEEDQHAKQTISQIHRSSLHYVHEGRSQIRLPSDRIRLIHDPHLQPGILSLEKNLGNKPFFRSESYNNFHFGGSAMARAHARNPDYQVLPSGGFIQPDDLDDTDSNDDDSGYSVSISCVEEDQDDYYFADGDEEADGNTNDGLDHDPKSARVVPQTMETRGEPNSQQVRLPLYETAGNNGSLLLLDNSTISIHNSTSGTNNNDINNNRKKVQYSKSTKRRYQLLRKKQRQKQKAKAKATAQALKRRQNPQAALNYVLTIHEDLYKNVVKEMADSRSPCGLYYCCHETESNHVHISVAIGLLILLFGLLIVGILIYPF